MIFFLDKGYFVDETILLFLDFSLSSLITLFISICHRFQLNLLLISIIGAVSPSSHPLAIRALRCASGHPGNSTPIGGNELPVIGILSSPIASASERALTKSCSCGLYTVDEIKFK